MVVTPHASAVISVCGLVPLALALTHACLQIEHYVYNDNAMLNLGFLYIQVC